MTAVIHAEGVRHVYPSGTVALDGVSLEIGNGLFGLLGSNGAGKSTLMRILCTLIEPSHGRVTIDGLDVVGDRRQVRTLFGYLPQEFGAWRLQRVTEVLDTLASLSGLTHARARRRRVAEVLESVGLSRVANRKVKQLSGGMVRRLGVAQALVHEPKVLVVDEPTVGLDPEERLRFRQLMTELARDRVIVLSTHIVADLGSGCTDLALLDRGQVAFRGSPAELVEQAAGRVVEVSVAEVDEPRVAERMEIVARRAAGGRVALRGVVGGGTGGPGGIGGSIGDGPGGIGGSIGDGPGGIGGTGGSTGTGTDIGADLPGDARPVDDVTLEEAYLAFMVGRGRSADELELDSE